MQLVTPGIGLVFWMLVTFLTVLFLLTKFAWKPILNMIKEREDHIDNALKSANEARNEMAKLQADNEKILAEARKERDAILKEARETQDMIIAEAKHTAKAEAEKMVKAAQSAIESEKNAALASIKQQIVQLSIEVAENVLRKELSSETKQSGLMNDMLKDIKLN
jgi:F-type H+-transporting ATPase subunit b